MDTEENILERFDELHDMVSRLPNIDPKTVEQIENLKKSVGIAIKKTIHKGKGKAGGQASGKAKSADKLQAGGDREDPICVDDCDLLGEVQKDTGNAVENGGYCDAMAVDSSMVSLESMDLVDFLKVYDPGDDKHVEELESRFRHYDLLMHKGMYFEEAYDSAVEFYARIEESDSMKDCKIQLMLHYIAVVLMLAEEHVNMNEIRADYLNPVVELYGIITSEEGINTGLIRDIINHESSDISLENSSWPGSHNSLHDSEGVQSLVADVGCYDSPEEAMNAVREKMEVYNKKKSEIVEHLQKINDFCQNENNGKDVVIELKDYGGDQDLALRDFLTKVHTELSVIWKADSENDVEDRLFSQKLDHIEEILRQNR